MNRPRRPARRSLRGQAFAELAITLPILMTVALLGLNVSQGFRFAVEAAGASRAGMMSGIGADSNDIGQSVRAEPASVINATTAWGTMGSGQANGSCDQLVPATGTSCGDTRGCSTPNSDPSSIFTAQPSLQACFAIRPCTLNAQYVCTTYGAWGSRPSPRGSGQPVALQVKVVVVYQVSAPVMGTLSTIYLSGTTQGLQLY